MSSKYPGGIISKTAPVPSGPYADSTAPGIWTLEQQAAYAKLGQWPTAGNVNPSAFIENLFSTYLYTGNGSTQTITNGIDLSTKGGLVWAKSRAAGNHFLYDTARGVNNYLMSNATDSQTAQANSLTAFNTTGFSIGDALFNDSAVNYASWTFREQPKFFDIVTFTTASDGSATVSHALGSTPAFVIVKRTDDTGLWFCWHTSLTSTNYYLFLNTTSAQTNSGGTWLTPSSTQVSFPSNSSTGALASSANYVMYVYASNAGGFGLTGTDNVISCGSFTTDGSGLATVSLGYEPQWVMVKRTDSTGNWIMHDIMRGYTADATSGTDAFLRANTSAAEVNTAAYGGPNATGFTAFYNASETYIYIAIRRGPMAVPTLGTSVFDPEAYTGTSAAQTITSGFPVDLSISKVRDQTYPGGWFDRLRGALQVIRSSNTDAEATSVDSLTGFDSNTGVVLGGGGGGRINTSPNTYAMWNLRRAPSFFDEVCYIGTGTAGQTYTHNLGVAPELMIVKNRTTAAQWLIYQSSLGNTQYLLFTTAASASGSFAWNNTSPTSSVFSVGTSGSCNTAGENYAAYLFATCAGVSKVGTYTGTGAAQTINCGFTSGSRFVLIKRTDSTGDWYIWDSARGIIPASDPYLLLNSDAVEVTGTDYVDTTSVGFDVTSTAPASINANGGTFIFLAIA